MLYQVEVKKQGTFVANHIVEAPNAMTAIDLVESYYTEPVSLEKALTENGHSQVHQVMLAINWHGYSFHAWAIKPCQKSEPTEMMACSYQS
ncbi:MAG TPA: hypothetical protein VEC93_15955 [Anaerolineae bacterium]|nr:hypothetical protein [Anaerolineae bacterium]